MSSDKLCVQCGEAFLQKRKDNITCSSTCRTKKYYKDNKDSLRDAQIKRSTLNYEDEEWRVNRIMCMAKNRASVHGIDFSLSLSYLLSVWSAQKGLCAVSGIKMILTKGRGRPDKYAPSLDKIKPDLGYVEGNVRFTAYQVNVAMADYGDASFIELCKNVMENNYGRR
jgi:hypothetical protein